MERQWISRTEVTGTFIDHLNASEAEYGLLGDYYLPADVLMRLDPIKFDQALDKYINSRYIKMWNVEQDNFSYCEVSW